MGMKCWNTIKLRFKKKKPITYQPKIGIIQIIIKDWYEADIALGHTSLVGSLR